jgi:hypothetical protein
MIGERSLPAWTGRSTEKLPPTPLGRGRVKTLRLPAAPKERPRRSLCIRRSLLWEGQDDTRICRRAEFSHGLDPLRSFVVGCLLDASARRGRRYPARAHAVAVDAARRLHCAARSGVAPQNSLRSLRSLRSNSRGESDDEARAARAPTPALRCSSPQKSPPPGTACREAHRLWQSVSNSSAVAAKARAGRSEGALYVSPWGVL